MHYKNKDMTPRERFLAVMHYEPVDRLPVMAVEPFEATALKRWRKEGLPNDIDPVDFFGMTKLIRVPVNFGPIPEFEHKIISEDEAYIVETAFMGATVRRCKENPTMFYGHIDHPVRTRKDWEEYKQRFRASSTGRLPGDWMKNIAPTLNDSPHPVGICFFPFFFRLGFYAMGMERFLTAFYEEPDLIHDMFSFWSNFVIENIRPVLDTLQVDFAVFGEDLAGKTGPLISPKTYEDFWFPYQDPIIKMLIEHKVPVICQWSAGEFKALLPTMMEHGFNCTWPLECLAGMDAPSLRQSYGRKLLLGGNIPKEALIAGPDAIDDEIKRLMPLIRGGGFMPALDDMVSPDMPFSHYRYMIEKLRAIR